MNVKRKGNAGELELLHLLQKRGITCRRNEQRYIGGKDNPDLEVLLPDGRAIHAEVKRRERLSVYEAMDQAVRDSAGTGRIPAVFFRSNRKPWLLIMRLEDVLPGASPGMISPEIALQELVYTEKRLP